MLSEALGVHGATGGGPVEMDLRGETGAVWGDGWRDVAAEAGWSGMWAGGGGCHC